MTRDMRRLVRVVCCMLLIAAIGFVVWMANNISRHNIDTFRDWKSLYDYITLGGVVFCCVLLGAMAVNSRSLVRRTMVWLGAALFICGIGGHYGFEYLSNARMLSLTPPRMQLKPNAAETVLGYHYDCPRSGGYVAFGDGSVRYIDREQFARLPHADKPEYPPEFTSPLKQPAAGEQKENVDEQQDNSELGLALKSAKLTQERIEHSNNLKWMAEDHFRFEARDGIRSPLKPEHFRSYPGMTDELRKAISDGTYVWYFGWNPIDSNYYVESKVYADAESQALWYEFTSWASVYLSGFGTGLLLAGLTLMMKYRNHKRVEDSPTIDHRLLR